MSYYSMTLTWQQTCRFIFFEWYSKTITTFAIGCAITLLLAFFTMSLPKVRKSLETILFKREKNSSFESNYQSLQGSQEEKFDTLRMTAKQIIIRKRVIPAIYGLMYAFLHVVLMIIMMSMNGYVILSIIAGYTIGFAVFCDPPCKSKTSTGCAKGCS